MQQMRGDHRVTLSPGIPGVSERGPVAMLGGEGDTGHGGGDKTLHLLRRQHQDPGDPCPLGGAEGSLWG